MMTVALLYVMLFLSNTLALLLCGGVDTQTFRTNDRKYTGSLVRSTLLAEGNSLVQKQVAARERATSSKHDPQAAEKGQGKGKGRGKAVGPWTSQTAWKSEILVNNIGRTRHTAVCTESQRVPRRTWWAWKERLSHLREISLQFEGNTGDCLTALGELGWLQAVDGWAQARWGAASVSAFNGTFMSKDLDGAGNPANVGDFVADHHSMLRRMVAMGDAPLNASAVEFINDALLSRQSESGCVSTFDPWNDSRESPCAQNKLKPEILAQQLHDMDPALYDVHAHRRSEIVKDSKDGSNQNHHRLRLLQSYLDDYNAQIGKTKLDDHERRLNALVLLAWRYAWLHPFCDGNGRTRTLIVQRELCRLGYHPSVQFDNNLELFRATLPMIKEALVEGLLLWEDAYAFSCIPWTPDWADQHRQHLGAKAVGLPAICSAENNHLMKNAANAK